MTVDAARMKPRIAIFAALGGGALGASALAGYALDQPWLISFSPGLRGMSPITATGLLAIAASVVFEGRGLSRTSRVFAFAAAVIGLVMLGVHAAFGSDVFSPAVCARAFSCRPEGSGRTSIATAACLVMLGSGAFLRGRPRLADPLNGAVAVVSGFAILGYAYGVNDLYAVPLFATMAVNTAVALLALALASTAVRPDRGWAAIVASSRPGGGATRRQLAFILTLPLVGFGLLKLTDAARIGPSAAVALLVMLTIAPLALLILRDGRCAQPARRGEAGEGRASGFRGPRAR